MSHYRTHKHVHTKKDFVDLHGIAKGQVEVKNFSLLNRSTRMRLCNVDICPHD